MIFRKFSFQLFIFLLVFSIITISSVKAQEQENEKNSIKEIIQEFPFTETVYLQDQNEIQQKVYGQHTKNEGITNGLLYFAS